MIKCVIRSIIIINLPFYQFTEHKEIFNCKENMWNIFLCSRVIVKSIWWPQIKYMKLQPSFAGKQHVYRQNICALCTEQCTSNPHVRMRDKVKSARTCYAVFGMHKKNRGAKSTTLCFICLSFFFLHSIGFYSLRDDLWFSTNILYFFPLLLLHEQRMFVVIDPFKKM